MNDSLGTSPHENDHVKINAIARNKARRLSVQRRKRERLAESFPALFSPERIRREEASSLARTPPSIRGLVKETAAAADSETVDGQGREWDLYSPDIYRPHGSASSAETSKENAGNNRPARPGSLKPAAPLQRGKGSRPASLAGPPLGERGGAERRRTLAAPSNATPARRQVLILCLVLD